jgi:hypothetical protein
MAGSGSNGTTEPSESTTLLGKDAIKPIDPSLSEDGNANGNGYGGIGDSSKSGGSIVDEEVDAEHGEVEQADNPLFEGNAEMAKKMHLLFPAVAIGVSSSFISLRGVRGAML